MARGQPGSGTEETRSPEQGGFGLPEDELRQAGRHEGAGQTTRSSRQRFTGWKDLLDNPFLNTLGLTFAKRSFKSQ